MDPEAGGTTVSDDINAAERRLRLAMLIWTPAAAIFWLVLWCLLAGVVRW